MIEENNWDQVTNADMVEGSIERISRAIKIGKAAGLSEVNVGIIAANNQVEKEVKRKLWQIVLHEKSMPDDCKTSVAV